MCLTSSSSRIILLLATSLMPRLSLKPNRLCFPLLSRIFSPFFSPLRSVHFSHPSYLRFSFSLFHLFAYKRQLIRSFCSFDLWSLPSPLLFGSYCFTKRDKRNRLVVVCGYFRNTLSCYLIWSYRERFFKIKIVTTFTLLLSVFMFSWFPSLSFSLFLSSIVFGKDPPVEVFIKNCERSVWSTAWMSLCVFVKS